MSSSKIIFFSLFMGMVAPLYSMQWFNRFFNYRDWYFNDHIPAKINKTDVPKDYASSDELSSDYRGATPLAGFAALGEIPPAEYGGLNQYRHSHINQHGRKTGRTTLHYAVMGGNPAIIKHLIENAHTQTVMDPSKTPIDLNAKDNEGNTPLHYAARQGKKEIVKMLREAGAFTSSYNNKLQTPLDIARENNFTEIVELLSPTTVSLPKLLVTQSSIGQPLSPEQMAYYNKGWTTPEGIYLGTVSGGVPVGGKPATPPREELQDLIQQQKLSQNPSGRRQPFGWVNKDVRDFVLTFLGIFGALYLYYSNKAKELDVIELKKNLINFIISQRFGEALEFAEEHRKMLGKLSMQDKQEIEDQLYEARNAITKAAVQAVLQHPLTGEARDNKKDLTDLSKIYALLSA
jgi:Ankyrin repeats (3 copies)